MLVKGVVNGDLAIRKFPFVIFMEKMCISSHD